MFTHIVKMHRERLGLTQSKLSQVSGVSLPTIQNIEAGRANPELETVERLVTALGMEVQFISRKVDWDFLSLCGVPLLNLKGKRDLCTKEKFLMEMRLALLECDSSRNDRKLKAIGATLLALQTHYPMIYEEFARAKISQILVKNAGLLKLRRIAIEGLSRFL